MEEAAREYKKRTGRPFVLVIDAVDRLAEHCPDLLATFQVRMHLLGLPVLLAYMFLHAFYQAGAALRTIPIQLSASLMVLQMSTGMFLSTWHV